MLRGVGAADADADAGVAEDTAEGMVDAVVIVVAEVPADAVDDRRGIDHSSLCIFLLHSIAPIFWNQTRK